MTLEEHARDWHRVERRKKTPANSSRKVIFWTNHNPTADRWEEIKETPKGWCVMLHSRVAGDPTDERYFVPFTEKLPSGTDMNAVAGYAIPSGRALTHMARQGQAKCLRRGREVG